MPRSTSSSPPPRLRWRRAYLHLAVASALYAPAALTGQEVTAVGDLLLETAPGATLTLSYRIVSDGASVLQLTPAIAAPQGWKLLTGGEAFALGPEGSDVQLVTFSLPSTAAAGEYTVGYTVHTASGDGAVAAEDRRVVVTSVDRLRLEVLDHAKRVLAGDGYEALFRLTNESNRRHVVRLDLRQSHELPLVWGPQEIEISSLESADVRLLVDTPPLLTAELRHQIILTAQFETAPAVTERTSIETIVLPSRTTSDHRWHRLDGELTVRAVAEQTRREGSHSQPNATLLLGGDLDDDGRRHLELFLQGPEVSGPGPLRTIQEELYAQLTTPTLDLVVGDFDPTPSRLVTHFRGRGARLRFGRGIWGLGGRYQETPHYSRRRIEERAVHGELELGRNAIRIEYVERAEPAAATRSELVDLEAVLRPLSHLSLRLGLAYGRLWSRSAKPTEGLGGEVEVVGERKRWSYNLLYLYGEDGFPGQYAGRSALYGGISGRLTQRLSARSSARRGLAREEPDVLYTVPPIETEYSNGLHYRLPRGATLFLEHLNRDREEVSDVAAVDFQETTYRLGVRQDLGKADVMLRLESGDGEDRVERSSFDLRRYSLQTSYRPGTRTSLQAEVEQTRETTLDGRADDALSALLRAQVQLSAKLALDGYYRQREREFRTSSSSAHSSLRLVRELPRAHEIALELAQTWTTSVERETDRAVVLAYTVPLSVPIRRRTNVGAIHGRVRSEQGGRPLSNVMIRLGGAVARSGQDGAFSIAALEAGSYPLVLDTARLGYRLLSSAANPELVTVAGGDGDPLELWITTAGVVRGTITREPTEAERWSATDRPLSEQQPDAALAVAGVVLELSDGQTTLRRLTYGDGRFTFDPLRPGSWKLRVVGPLPSGFVASPAERTIVVTAGEEIESPVRLVAERARQRRIPSDRDTSIEVIGFSASGQD